MSNTQKIPGIELLKAIEPSVDSVTQNTLQYDLLDARATKHAVYETARQRRFFESKDGSLDEDSAARQSALQYLLMTAQKLGHSSTDESRNLWSQRFTTATSELYGAPEAETAIELATVSVNTLIANAKQSGVDNDLIEEFEHFAKGYGLSERSDTAEKSEFEDVANEFSNHLNQTYEDVFDVLGFDYRKDVVSVDEFADKSEDALQVLARNHDEAWENWMVERNPEKSHLSVSAASKKIIVGMRRREMTPKEAKGLFVHEVLVHAFRGVNGGKISEQLGKGLPGYLEAEEGLGVFSEYAVTGSIPEKNIDRYTDIGMALGMFDGKEKTRQEMIDFAGIRALLRNELKPTDEQASLQTVMKGVYSHVNRMYRGSLGNEHIGLFTKDIAYQNGFITIGAFIEQKRQSGQSMTEIMEYLMQGKFDPLDQKHQDEIEKSRDEQ